MDSTLISIKQACDSLKISRATLYKILKQHGIKTTKQKGNHSYISTLELETVKATLTTPNAKQNESVESDSANFYRFQLEKLEAKNELLLTENGNLKLELGKWQGRAEAYQQQLLRLEDSSVNKQVIYELNPTRTKGQNDFTENTSNGFITFFKKIFK